MDALKKEMEINTQFLLLQIKTVRYKKYTELWNGIKNLMEKINNKLSEHGKEFMKMKFN